MNTEQIISEATSALQLGNVDEAIRGYQKAISLSPHSSLAHSNLGIAYRQQNQLTKALENFDRAITLDSRSEIAHSNRGVVYADLGLNNKALEDYTRAINLNPKYIEPYFNRANLFVLLRDLPSAIADFECVIRLSPDHYQAKWNRALALLLAGDLKNGFEAFESRWEIPAFCSEEKFPQPIWLGKDLIFGKTIFLHSEQGLGDTLQFCRYAGMVKFMGAAKVILGVEKPLKKLMQSLDGVDLVITRGDALPSFDFHTPMMSLPLAFGTSLDSIPAKASYLTPDPLKVDYWSRKLGEHSKLRVGLVWSGGFRPGQPELWEINRRRNIPLENLAPLAIAGVEFVSLQKGADPEADLERLIQQGWNGPQIRNYVNEFEDFSDTAALIANLDLVISVDTSTAHLAAALGKPVWLLNRYDTCWRWLLGRSDSPWYPTLKLYRQSAMGDWNSVIEQVKRDLLEVTAPLRL